MLETSLSATLSRPWGQVKSCHGLHPDAHALGYASRLGHERHRDRTEQEGSGPSGSEQGFER
jgi:hypothetical protein